MRILKFFIYYFIFAITGYGQMSDIILQIEGKDVTAKECRDCKERYPLCPASYLQAAYHLTKAIAFPSFSIEPGLDKKK